MTSVDSKQVDSFLVYGRDNCPYCVKAKQLLEQKKVWWVYVDLAKNPEIRERMIKRGHKTVPVIYNGYEFIGGYTELEEYFNNAS